MTIGGLEAIPPAVGDDEVDPGTDGEGAAILLAARTVMVRNGWWGFKVDSVLRESGLSTRSFYRHYGSKNELLMTLLDHEMQAVAAHLATRASGCDGADAALVHWVSGSLAMAYEEPLLRPAIMFAEHWRELLTEFPARMNAILDSLIRTIVPILERGRAEGVWPAVRPEQDAFCVFYLVATLTADLAAGRGSRPFDEILTTVIPFLRRALGATELSVP